MFLSKVARFPRKPFSELDFARHMPKEYVERMKRTVPRKVFGGRFGAPEITRWYLHPDDHVPSHLQPWTHDELGKTMKRVNDYHGKKLANKFVELRRPRINRMPDEKWTFFPGDQVEIMVGKDKGKQGTILRVSRQTNEVVVDGMHCKLEEEMPGSEKVGVEKMMRWKEQPLDASKGHVLLVDPNDNRPCAAKWVLNDSQTEYIRISESSGYEIPLPSQAKVTYEYLQAEKYVECEEKDTPSDIVLERTYVPKLCSFEEEILSSAGVQETRVPKPTYWY